MARVPEEGAQFMKTAPEVPQGSTTPPLPLPQEQALDPHTPPAKAKLFLVPPWATPLLQMLLRCSAQRRTASPVRGVTSPKVLLNKLQQNKTQPDSHHIKTFTGA